ncbi:hypothetical protein RB195_002940 [Necator americanus]|uniref:Uncharacterized protein n=1 Tax=Necator americanus TaxID=51031 RepID=A0ABR1DM15_NECAM
MRAKHERLTDGYPGKPGAIRQGMRDPSNQHFFVADGLMRLATVEWLHTSLVARLRVLISGSSLAASRKEEFSTVWNVPTGFVFEIGVSACEASEPDLDNPDGSGALAQSAVDIAGCCRCSTAAAPFTEDGSKLLLRN